MDDGDHLLAVFVSTALVRRGIGASDFLFRQLRAP